MRSVKLGRTRPFLSVALLSLASVLALSCKKDEPPPPLPSAAPAATAPQEPLELVPEEPIVDAGTDTGAQPKKGVGRPRASLSKCCAALAQNAKLAPPPNNAYFEQAAAICNSLAGMGKDQTGAMAAIQAALKGAGMPTACQ